VDPVLGGVVVERQQHVEVVADLRDRLGPFGAVEVDERSGGVGGVLAVLGVVDLGQRSLRAGLGRLRQRGEDVADFVPLMPTSA
jgi:hypothetical protein